MEGYRDFPQADREALSAGFARYMALIAAGTVFGVTAALVMLAVILFGPQTGPGTPLGNALYLAGLGGLALSPLLIVDGLYGKERAPHELVFGLAYLTGFTITIIF
ncbi:hypothetical protein AB1M95_07310 [Sulfitobacter sp. LCG007]